VKKINTRDLTLTVVIGSLYTVMVIALAPISYGPIQLRMADTLIPLSAIFGWPAIIGVSLGCFIGNAYYWLGVYDVVFGSVANLIAAILIFQLRKKPLLACIMGSLPIGLIVGGYLWIFFPPPDIFGLNLPMWLAMMISITISTLISIAVIGYTLLKVLTRSKVINYLKSSNIRIYLGE
jgi:uncharacterized membrane protein